MKLLTVFQIADILREPPHRCEYVIRKYRRLDTMTARKPR
jgi:hypothetical protein